MNIGEKIRARRTELGWSLRELADKMGYANHSAVQRIEKGVVDIPQSKIEKFSQVLGVPISYLMNWEEVQKNNDVMSDIIVEMRSNDAFLSLVNSIYKLDEKKRNAIQTMVSALLK